MGPAQPGRTGGAHFHSSSFGHLPKCLHLRRASPQSQPGSLSWVKCHLASQPCSPPREDEEDDCLSTLHSSKHWPGCPASRQPFLVTLEPEPNPPQWKHLLQAHFLERPRGSQSGPRCELQKDVDSKLLESENVFSSQYPQHPARM